MKSSYSKRTTTRQQLDCPKTLSGLRRRVLGRPTATYSPLGSHLSTRSTHGRLKMVVRKLKAAIYKCVLARGLCKAVTSIGCLPDHHSAGGRIPYYLSSSRLVSLMTRRFPLVASVILCRQPNTVHQHGNFA